MMTLFDFQPNLIVITSKFDLVDFIGRKNHVVFDFFEMIQLIAFIEGRQAVAY